MESKSCQVFNNNPQGSQLKGLPKTDGGIVYKQILINAKFQIGERGHKTADWEKGTKVKIHVGL
jgi:hypothetical protein